MTKCYHKLNNSKQGQTEGFNYEIPVWVRFEHGKGIRAKFIWTVGCHERYSLKHVDENHDCPWGIFKAMVQAQCKSTSPLDEKHWSWSNDKDSSENSLRVLNKWAEALH